MRRRRPRAERLRPLPDLPRGLSREAWLAAMREWADQHEPGSDPWAEACVVLDEVEAFELDAVETTARVSALALRWLP